jgi:hypothetical protein
MPGRAVLESIAEQIAHELYGGETYRGAMSSTVTSMKWR